MVEISQYLYSVKYTTYEESLCKLEMKYLFGSGAVEKIFFSTNYIDPSRSPFIKLCISVIYTGDTLEDILNQILVNNLSYEKFKVSYIHLEDNGVEFEERRKIESKIGFNINGQADIHHPVITLGITKLHNKWIFGIYEGNKSLWELHNKKPKSYSNGLGVRVSRAIVNIAIANNLKCKVIDPCCGVGTVLIEALSMGLDIRGCEINPYIAENAKRNLEYFGYDDVVTYGDMHNINDVYDTAIVDLPYGVFSLTTLKEQVDIMKTTRRIAGRAVFVTFEDMDKHLMESGFNIVDRCSVSKGKFVRYIAVCE